MFAFLYHLSVTHAQYTEEIQQHFEDTDITLFTVTFLSPEIKNQLSSFSDEATSFDFTATTQQVGVRGLAHSPVHLPSCVTYFLFLVRLPQINNVSSINLNTTADKLDALAAIQVSPQLPCLVLHSQLNSALLMHLVLFVNQLFTCLKTNTGTQNELRNQAMDLRLIQTNIETTIFPQLVSIFCCHI